MAERTAAAEPQGDAALGGGTNVRGLRELVAGRRDLRGVFGVGGSRLPSRERASDRPNAGRGAIGPGLAPAADGGGVHLPGVVPHAGPQGRPSPTDPAGRLRSVADRVAAQPPGRRREALVGVMLSRGVDAKRETDDLAAWLNRAWTWCEANPDHPETAAREERWIAGLRRYEALSGALRTAQDAL